MFQANFENNQKKIFSLGHTKTGNQSIIINRIKIWEISMDIGGNIKTGFAITKNLTRNKIMPSQ